MSGNSKVIGVTMSRSASEQQLPLSYVTADVRSYCSLVWAIIVSVTSHQFCLSGTWKPDKLLVVFVLSDCHRVECNAANTALEH